MIAVGFNSLYFDAEHRGINPPHEYIFLYKDVAYGHVLVTYFPGNTVAQ